MITKGKGIVSVLIIGLLLFPLLIACNGSEETSNVETAGKPQTIDTVGLDHAMQLLFMADFFGNLSTCDGILVPKCEALLTPYAI